MLNAVTTDCILFAGKLTDKGYARITVRGRRHMAHDTTTNASMARCLRDLNLTIYVARDIA